MGNLKEIRIRIASVESTQKITSAMKLVSAAKLRRAQSAIISLRPYSSKLNEILQSLSGSADTLEDIPFFSKREPEHVVIVAITANRGLCGSFNANVTKEINRLITEQYAAQQEAGNVKIYCLGKKGKEQLSKSFSIMDSNETIIDNPNFDELVKIAEELMNGFINKSIDKIDIVYNQFVNPATQRLSVEQFLPVKELKMDDSKTALNHDFIFEPSKEELLQELIPKILKLQFYKTLIDSIASEHGARMTSMAKATDNADEILKDLKLKYNNARQSSITNELIEIVSGAEVLKG